MVLKMTLELILKLFSICFFFKIGFIMLCLRCFFLNCSFEWTDVRRHVYFNHIFNEAKMHSKKSWQVRVVLHELRIRHYTGINEIVYCQVDIGGKKQQKTKETHIDNLIFENEVKCFMFGFNFKRRFSDILI